MYVTLELIESILNSQPSNQAEEGVTTNYSDKAPGRFDKWLMMEGETSCWQKRETKRAKNTKKKIIISDGLLKYYVPSIVEHELFSLLCENYQVYCWPGSDVNFSSTQKSDHFSGFWEDRKTIKSQSKKEVEASLTLQGISTDDYIIIDQEYFDAIMERIIPKVRNYLTSLYRSTYDRISILPDILDHDEKIFKKIELSNPTKEEIKNLTGMPKVKLSFDKKENLDNLALLRGKVKSITVDSVIRNNPNNIENDICKKIEILGDTFNREPAKSLLITSNKIPTIGKCVSLEELIINESFRGIDLREAIHLKKIVINGKSVDEIYLPKNAPIEELKIENLKTNAKFYQLNYPKLKKLTLIKSSHPSINLSNFKELEHLEIEDDNLEELDLSNLGNLKTLKVSCKNLQTIKLPNSLINFELNHYLNDILDLSQCLQLTTLRLNHCNYDDIKFPANLENIEIKNSTIKTISLRHCENLKNLTLGYTNITNFDVPKQIETLQLLTFSDENLINHENCPMVKRLFSSSDFHKISKIDKKNLKEIHISYDDSGINPISEMPVLENLHLKNNSPEKRSIENCANLRKIHSSQAITIRNLPNLTEVELSHCDQRAIDELSTCKKLNKLIIAPDTPVSIVNNKTIEYLHIINNNTKLKRNYRVQHCDHLKVLHIESGDKIQELNLENLPALEELVVTDCSDLGKLNLSACPNLKRLIIKFNGDCENIDLSKLTHLELLSIKGDNLKTLDVSGLKNLKTLGISCSKLPDKLDFSYCRELEYVNIHSSISVPRDIIMKNLPKLKYVDVWINIDTKKTSIIELSNNKNLRSANINVFNFDINLTGCEKLYSADIQLSNTSEIKGLNTCRSLHHFTTKIKSTRRNLKLIEKAQQKLLMNLPTCCDSSIKCDDEANYIYDASDYTQNIAQINPISKDVISSEELLQHTRNQQNPISTYSLNDNIVSDDQTGILTKSTHNGEMLVTFEAAGKPIYKSDYRIQVFDEVKLENGTIKFVSKPNINHLVAKSYNIFTDTDIEQKKLFVQAHPEYVCGYFSGTLQPNKHYPIPLREAPVDDSIDAYAKNQAIDIFWDPIQRQYYMQLKKGQLAQQVDLLYLYKRNPNYNKISNTEKSVLDHTGDTINNEVEKFLKNLPSTHTLQLLNRAIPIEDKLQFLTSYCSSFEDVSLVNYIPNTDVLFSLIKEKTGSCRHRSQAFMLLARYLGVKVQMIYNEDHAFCEVLYQTEKGDESWHRHDFSGAFMLDLTAKDKFKNPLEAKSNKSPKPKQAAVDNSASSTPSPQFFTNAELSIKAAYQKAFEECIEKTKVDKVDQLVSDNEISPLLYLSDNQDPFLMSRYLKSQLSNSKRFLYIHNAKDFARYLKPFRLEDGTTVRVSGPLSYILNRGGVVVVNWSNFTATEIASYKSILDPEPTLLGQPFDKNRVKVIGFTKENTEDCSAFSSRCKPYQLSDNLKSDVEKVYNENNQTIEIDLYHSSNWREKLYGQIKHKSDEIKLMQGPLLQAINTNCTLILKNPPNDTAFNLLKERLKEDRLLYNGEYLPIHPQFKIETQSYEKLPITDQVNILLARPKGKKAIYLNLNNFNDLYERLIISNDHKAIDSAGYLKEYNKDTYFYITEYIPKSDWLELLDHIQQKMPGKVFDFVLAPGISITGIKENQVEIKETKFKDINALKAIPACVFSNDPDFIVKQVYDHCKKQTIQAKQGEHSSPIIVDITPQTSFSDLIASTHIEHLEEGKIKYIHEPKPILQALEEGRTVILNGDLSPILYQQLLPLFDQPPQLISNGKEIKFKNGARLISVQSTKAAQQLPIYDYYSATYHLDDYRSAFSKDDQHHIDQISQFYQWANKIPGGGMGRPESSPISFYRLNRMVNALKKRTAHPANPLKGIYHYDFPRDSEDYAYLNVIGKRCFYYDTQKSLNTNKLKRIIKQYKISTIDDLNNHIWKVLNCYSGADLIRLLGKDLNQSLGQKATKPTINEDILSKVWEECKQVMELPEVARKSNHIDKRTVYLKYLLKDTETPLIFLKGDPGAGKTHDVRQLKDELSFDYYEGANDIVHWLNGKSNREMILLLDEANMSAPGTWDFFKGLIRGHKTVTYKGKEYTITDRHKVIFTGNPENFPERYYHKLFQDHAETIYYKMHDDESLRSDILPSLLSKFNLDDKETIDLIIEAYHLIQDFNPTFGFSNRDLESLVQRFNASLSQTQHKNDKNTFLYNACVCEFAGTLQDDNDRQIFIKSLANKFHISPDANILPNIAVTPDCFIPFEKAYLADSIEQDLLIREKVLNREVDDAMFYKKGVLIEGDAGLGKSFLLKSILQKHGFTPNHIDPQKRYYEISAGNEQYVYDLLLKAYHEGSMVILDEINLDESHEEFLIQLLTGVELIEEERDIYITSEMPNIESLNKYANSYLFIGDQDNMNVCYVNRHGEIEKLQIKDVVALKKEMGDIEVPVKPTLLKTLIKPDVSLRKIQEMIIPWPGFSILSSQNQSYYKGRKSISKALRNRLHMCYMAPYSKEALLSIAKHYHIPHPEIFVDTYLEALQKYGDKMNMRIFYTVLRKYKSEARLTDNIAQPIVEPNLRTYVTEQFENASQTNTNSTHQFLVHQQTKANAKKQFAQEQKSLDSILKRLKSHCDFYKQHIDSVMNRNTFYKKEAINELIEILKSDNLPQCKRLELFIELYNVHRATFISERLEHQPLQFLKDTLRSLPIKKLREHLNRVKGEVFSSHIDKILEQTDFPLVKYDTIRLYEILRIAKDEEEDANDRLFCVTMMEKLEKFTILNKNLTAKELDTATASIRSEIYTRFKEKLPAYDAQYEKDQRMQSILPIGIVKIRK